MHGTESKIDQGNGWMNGKHESVSLKSAIWTRKEKSKNTQWHQLKREKKKKTKSVMNLYICP